MAHSDGSEDTGGALPGSPGRRALGAMALAARRAREGSPPGPVEPTPGGGGTVSDGPPTQWRERAAPPRDPLPHWVPPPRRQPPPRRDPGTEGGSPGPRQERWLRAAVGLTAALVVAAAISLTAVLATRSTPTSSGGTPTTAPTTHTSVPTGSARQHSGRSHGATSTSTTVVVAPGSPAQISSLSPSSGGPGQTVVIAGSGLMSSNGQIIATFDGQTAPTDCPQQTSCTVTVPTLSTPPTGPVTVIVTTAAGPSNGLRFIYQ